MAEPSTAPLRFQMVGSRAGVLAGPTVEAIEQQIQAIEDALERVPDFAFDLSKTLVESVCKTVLEDLGQAANPKWDCPQLLRETMNRLALVPRGHQGGKNARDSVEKTIRGMLQTIQGLCELRNKHGLASHGRDAQAARMDLRQATLAAQAADTIVSFLYRIHRDALIESPAARVYYEDHSEFNEAFDRDNELIRLGVVEVLPSRVLYHGDREAYKVALNEYLAEQSGAGNGAAAAAAGAAAPEAE